MSSSGLSSFSRDGDKRRCSIAANIASEVLITRRLHFAMARQESDREDVMREATALVDRAELIVPGVAEPVVIGFRREGAASVFFGQDPVFHFNSAGQLRRVFSEGDLLKADRGKLIRLRRQRTEDETNLLVSELGADEERSLLKQLTANLEELHKAIVAGRAHVSAQKPESADVLKRIEAWLELVSGTITIASRPNVGG